MLQKLRAWNRNRIFNRRLLAAIQPKHIRTCPLCEYRGLFTHHIGPPVKLEVKCPSCGSYDRHRMLWLWMRNNKLEEPILHFAAEPSIAAKLRILYEKYTTADLFSKADIKLNIERIDLPTASVRTVICNHVLEHVSDKPALDEIFRILSPGGTLIVSVPMIAGWTATYENASIRDPNLRVAHFGKSDHIRFYGSDFIDRLKTAGFRIELELTAEGPDVVEYSLSRGDKIFICRK